MDWHMLLLVGLIVSSLSLQCSKVQQGVLTNDQCIFYSGTQNSIKLQLCKTQNNPYCPPSTYANSTCTTNPINLQTVGLYCQTNNDCQGSATCHYQICRGLQEGAFCVESGDCDIGLACFENPALKKFTCQKQRQENEECLSEYQCRNDLGCGNNTCIPYFSLQEGDVVYNAICEESYSELCESFTCEPIVEKLGLRCIQPFVSKSQSPTVATQTSDCPGDSTSGDQYNSSLRCGYQQQGNAYCSAHSGDEVSLLYKQWWQKINGKDQNLCHTNQRRNVKCWGIRQFTPLKMETQDFEDAVNYTSSKYDWYHYPVMEVSESVTQQIYFTDYFNAKNLNYNYFLKDSYVYQCLAYKDNESISPKCTQIGDYDGTIFNAQCSNNQECDVETGTCSNYFKYPGESCLLNSECLGSNCLKGKCKGKDQSQQCATNSECDVGLFCSNSKCTAQKKLNEACQKTSDCQNNLACSGTQCVAMASQQKGQACLEDFLDLPSVSFACQSLHCSNKQCQDNSIKNLNTTCKADKDCKLSDSSQGQCACGLNTENQAYCKTQFGDASFTQALDYFGKYVKNNLQQIQGICHTDKRFDFDCWHQYFTSIDRNLYLGFAVFHMQIFDSIQNQGQGYAQTSLNTLKNYLNDQSKEIPFVYAEQQCPAYQCGTLPANQCVSYVNNVYTFQSCSSSQTCAFQEFMNSTCQDKSKQLSSIGMFCQQDSDCNSGTCQYQICRGDQEGQRCTDSSTCDIGLACIQDDTIQAFVCQTQRKEGQACDNDYQCENSLGCGNNVCMSYLSQKAGTIIKNAACEQGVSKLCDNLACQTLLSDQVSIQCLDLSTSVKTPPIETSYAGDCESVSVDQHFVNPLVCGMNKNQDHYCQINSGDQAGTSYKEAFKQVIGLDQGFCHTQQRYDPQCWAVRQYTPLKMDVKDFYLINQAILKESEYLNYPLDEAEQCVVQITYPDYYSSKYAPEQYIPSNVQQQCLQYIDDTQKQVPDGYCFITTDYQSKAIFRDCKSGETCNAQTGKCEKSLKYPGQKCSINQECDSNVCTSGVCVGKSLGNECSKNQECDIGFYCNLDTKQCTAQRNEGQSCTLTTDCQSDLACNGKVCVKVGSQMSGNDCIEDFPGTGFSYSCFSMNCKNNKCSNDQSQNLNNGTCKSDSDCPLSNGQNGQCQCGYRNDFSSYCKKQFGDPQIQQIQVYFLQYVYPLLQDIKGKCHTDLTFSSECWLQIFYNSIDLFIGFSVWQTSLFDVLYNQGTGFATVSSKILQAYHPQIWYEYPYVHYNGPQCYDMTCSNLPSQQCVSVDGSLNVELQACTDQFDSYCPAQQYNLKDTNCTVAPYTLSPVSLFCQIDQDCDFGNKCITSICRGSLEGEMCTTSDTCDVGLACILDSTIDLYTCQKQLTEGKSCENEFQCRNDLSCGNSTCMPYFSVKAQQIILNSKCEMGRNSLCESFTCKSVVVNDKLAVMCIDNFVSTFPPQPSSLITACQATNHEHSGGWYHFSYLTCGDDGNTYCTRNTGDQEALTYIQNFKAVMGRDQNYCHTTQRNNPHCWGARLFTPFKLQEQDLMDVAKLKKSEWEFKSYPMTVLSKDCTNQIFNQDYYLSKEKPLEFVPKGIKSQCLKFLDSDSQHPIEQGYCMQIDSYQTAMYSKTCDKKQFCDQQTSQCAQKKYLPGESCDINEDCQSQQCANNICQGKSISFQCSSQQECDVGLACIAGSCQKQQILGGNCKNSYECQNDLVCDGKVCVNYLSKRAGQQCLQETEIDGQTLTITDFSWACHSFNCVNNVCVDKPPNNTAHYCNLDDDCLLSDGTTGICECSQLKHGMPTCRVQYGDQVMVETKDLFLHLLSPYQSKIVGKCHTQRRFSYSCWKQVSRETNEIQALKAFALTQFQLFSGIYLNGADFEEMSQSTLENVYSDQFDEQGEVIVEDDCGKYTYVESLPDNLCVLYNDKENTYQVSACKSPETPFCPTLDQQNNTCVASATVQQIPGMYCMQNTDCLTQMCVNNFCKGLQQGDACRNETDYSCDVGLSCIKVSGNFQCQPQLSQGEQCVIDYNCKNDLVCVGTCIPYFSIPNYQVYEGDCTTDSTSFACQSYTCQNINQTHSMCVEPFVSLKSKTTPIETNETLDCLGTNEGENITFTEIVCDYSDYAKQYCAAQTGEQVTVNYVSLLKYALGKDNGICHSALRYDPKCWAVHRMTPIRFTREEFNLILSLKQAHMMYLQFPSVLTADINVASIYFQDYYQATYNPSAFFPQSMPNKCMKFNDGTLTQGSCIQQVTQGDVTLTQKCPANQVCNSITGQCQARQKYPGEKCNANSDCFNMACIQNTCRGGNQGDKCSDHGDCNAGYYCDIKICARQVQPNSNCTNSYMCPNHQTCVNYQCVNYMSIPNNQSCEVDNTPLKGIDIQGFSWGCSSLYCNQQNLLCEEAPQRTATACNLDSDCKTTNENVQGLCNCPKSTAQQAYCSAQAGDAEVQQFKNEFQTFINRKLLVSTNICHTARRFSYYCWSELFENNYAVGFAYSMYKFMNFMHTLNADISSNTLQAFYPELDAQRSALYLDSCPHFQCNNLENDTCIKYVDFNSTFEVQACKNKKKSYCQPSLAPTNVNCQPAPQTPSNFPGMYCEKNEDCVGALKCQNNKCEGYKQGVICYSAADNKCEVGLACLLNQTDKISYSCQKQLKKGDVCENEFQCENNMTCIGTCVDYLSGQVNQEFEGDNCLNNYHSVCSTLTCVQTGVMKFKCIDAFVSIKNVTQTKYVGDCLSLSPQGDFYFAPLVCDFQQGQSYCSAKAGDNSGKEYIEQWQNVMNLDNQKCHSYARRNPYCWGNDDHLTGKSQFKQIVNYTVTKETYQKWPQTKYAPECVQKVYFSEYYIAANEPDLFKSSAFMMSLSFLLLLVM